MSVLLTTPAHRLATFRDWIARGWALDLNDAVRLNSQLLRKARALTVLHARIAWGGYLLGVEARRRLHLDQYVLSLGVCAFCGQQGATSVRYRVPLSEGGTHHLGNLVACCDACTASTPAVGRLSEMLSRANRVSAAWSASGVQSA
jgi:hypothetical protein